MRRALLILLLCLLAAVEYRVAIGIDGKRLQLSLSAIEHLLDGQTHWRVYGGRVLTPLLLRGAMRATGAAALPCLLFLMLALGTATKFAAWWGLRPLARSDGEAWAAMLALTLGWLLLHNGQPAYLWDVVDLGLAAVTVGLLARGGGSVAAWALLLLLASLNREGAVLLGLAPLIQALTPAGRDLRAALLYLALLLTGLGLAFGLREAVFVRATLEQGEGVARAAAGVVHLRLFENLATIAEEVLGLLDPARLLALRPLVLLPALVVPFAVVARPRLLWQRAPGLAGLALVLLAATLVAGEVMEGRVWTLLLPIDAGLVMVATGGATNTATRPPVTGGSR